jgi:trimeric autotransporter adhesin
MGTAIDDNPRLQLFNTASCTVATLNANSLACASGSATTTLSLNTASTPGGAGLTVGTTYLIRVFTGSGTAPSGTSSTWNFNICVTDLIAARIEISKSYINVSKRSTGGTVVPGDTLEMRATFVIFDKAADSLAYYDTLFSTRGLRLVPSSIQLRTNEGITYKSFTDAPGDADAGWYSQTGADTLIRINFGSGASQSARGKLFNTSRPSVFNSTCIIMATYRVVVYAPYNTKINFRNGGVSYRDVTTGVNNKKTFVKDSLVVYQSPGLCPNAISANNAIGVEFNGTFGTASGPAPLVRNRGTTAYTPTYIYKPFAAGTGPQDYYYAIANNTSAQFTTATTWPKPQGDPDGAGPLLTYRVFTVWDISGDHTGATDPLKGNPPCDTTRPVSASNPCGYMLVINSAYKTDTAFNYIVTNLCPNTYYEISAWLKNVCYKCSCDSLGNGSTTGSYQPATPGDSSGVKPNLAFDVNGKDYYTTGNLSYIGTTPQGSDSSNRWVKKGFTYLTGASETSFNLTIRNNAPGGGGNDWALDDISVATCLPNMKYSPSLDPNVCRMNPLTIYDTVRSYFDNYVYYKWQRSTDNGTNWTDVTAALGPATPTWNGTAWEFVTAYTIPPADTDTTNNGDRYRVIVATTSPNLSNTNCQFTDGISIINLSVTNCGRPLKTDLLSFNGKLVIDKSTLTWTTSKEDGPVKYTIERSNDSNNNFLPAGLVSSHNNYTATVNSYSFIDPVKVMGKVFYRLILTDQSGIKKYSRIIELSGKSGGGFTLSKVINPFNQSVEFDVASPEEVKIDVELIDLLGHIVRKRSYSVHTGANALSLPDTGNLPDGIYIFRVKNNEMVINRKVLKKSF